MQELIELVSNAEELNPMQRLIFIYIVSRCKDNQYIKITNTEIVRALKTSYATVNRAMQVLEKSGFITRILTNEADRRNRRIIRVNLNLEKLSDEC